MIKHGDLVAGYFLAWRCSFCGGFDFIDVRSNEAGCSIPAGWGLLFDNKLNMMFKACVSCAATLGTEEGYYGRIPPKKIEAIRRRTKRKIQIKRKNNTLGRPWDDREFYLRVQSNRLHRTG